MRPPPRRSRASRRAARIALAVRCRPPPGPASIGSPDSRRVPGGGAPGQPAAVLNRPATARPSDRPLPAPLARPHGSPPPRRDRCCAPCSLRSAAASATDQVPESTSCRAVVHNSHSTCRQILHLQVESLKHGRHCRRRLSQPPSPPRTRVGTACTPGLALTSSLP